MDYYLISYNFKKGDRIACKLREKLYFMKAGQDSDTIPNRPGYAIQNSRGTIGFSESKAFKVLSTKLKQKA
jgi:hypothetical protein